MKGEPFLAGLIVGSLVMAALCVPIVASFAEDNEIVISGKTFRHFEQEKSNECSV